MMKKKGYLINNSNFFLKRSQEFLKFGKLSSLISNEATDKGKCDSPHLYFHVDSKGHINPCLDITSDISVLDHNFISKYKSGEINQKLKQMTLSCSGCIYPCYSELSYFCHNLSVFIERGLEELRYKKHKRKPLSFEQMIDLSQTYKESISQENNNQNELKNNKLQKSEQQHVQN